MPEQILLEVRDLQKHFPIIRGFFNKVVGQVRAVDGISFALHEGECLGLVGESGSGKTTVGRTVMTLSECERINSVRNDCCLENYRSFRRR